jgi:hypothetical protein
LERVASSGSLTTAVLVADVLSRWPSIAAELSDLLTREGLHEEAEVVLATMPDGLRPALAATRGTESHELLEARALARALKPPLSIGYPELSRELAASLYEIGASELALAFSDLADRASSTLQTAPAGGVTAAGSHREPQTSAKETA